MDSAWERALGNFIGYLPDGLAHWVVALELPAHTKIAQLLIPRLGSTEVFVLGESPPAAVAKAGHEYLARHDVGFLEFAVNDGGHQHTEVEYANALMSFAQWPRSRIKLCFDVWDTNFPILFAESAHALKERCHAIRTRLDTTDVLSYNVERDRSRLTLDCGGSKWVEYNGIEEFDYLLPSGEVACLPTSVTGTADLDGWIIGTVPFGLKYGRIHRGDLRITFTKRVITRISGRNTELCADLNMALERVPGLRSVAEVGIGQSRAVARAVHLHEAAYQWHERHLGLHLGLGAELAETFDANERSTGHHLDLVFATGTLVDETGVLLAW
jgi:leucyl aminopeptidase (aminopeptidase T)